MLQQFIDYIKREWAVLRGAPGAFVGLAVISLLSGVALESWHYSGQISTLTTQLNSKDGEIGRYRVALGIDKASQGNLVELTNDELRVKSINTASKLRGVCSSARAKDEAASKAEANLDAKTKGERVFARFREASDEIDRNVRSDTALVDNELRRRLRPEAIASIPGVPTSLYNAATGTPIDPLILGTAGGNGFSSMLCILADGIEQMAKLLPSDTGKR